MARNISPAQYERTLRPSGANRWPSGQNGVACAARARRTVDGRGLGWAGMLTAIAVLVATAPAFSDPTTDASANAACWRPGAAPALFSWSGTPGITCRDGADPATAVSPVPTSAPARDAAGDTARTGAPAQITFSGSAYVGVAVSF